MTMADKKPEAEPKNPATAAHDAPKPEHKAPTHHAAPKQAEAKPKAPAEKPAPKPEPAPPPAPRRTIEALLADKDFDPNGTVRAKLAERSVQSGAGQLAPADLVDDAGNPIVEA